MKTVNNTPEDNLKRIALYALKALLIALAIWFIVMMLLTASILEETKQDQQVYEMLEYHSAPGQLTTECDGYIKIAKKY